MASNDEYVPLRDYEYLDEDRLTDYLTTQDLPQVREIKQTIKEVSGRSDGLAVDSKAAERKGDIQVQKRTITILAKQSFTTLYQTLHRRGRIDSFGELAPVSTNNLSLGSVVEVTENFSPLFGRVSEPMARVLEHHAKRHNDDDSRRMAKILRACWRTNMFRNKKFMVFEASSSPEREVKDCSVVFSAEAKFIIRNPEEFTGALTVCGKVQEVRRSGKPLRLLDDLLGMPREDIEARGNRLKREYYEAERKGIEQAMNQNSSWWSSWLSRSWRFFRRHFLGIEDKPYINWEDWEHLKWEDTEIRCPVIIVTPLAVYR